MLQEYRGGWELPLVLVYSVPVCVTGVYRWMGRQSRHRSGTQLVRNDTGPSPARESHSAWLLSGSLLSLSVLCVRLVSNALPFTFCLKLRSEIQEVGTEKLKRKGGWWWRVHLLKVTFVLLF